MVAICPYCTCKTILLMLDMDMCLKCRRIMNDNHDKHPEIPYKITVVK